MFPFSMPGDSPSKNLQQTINDREWKKSEQIPWIQKDTEGPFCPSHAALLVVSQSCVCHYSHFGGGCTSKEERVYHSGFLTAVAITDYWCLCFGRQHPSHFVPFTTLLVSAACPIMLIRLQGRSSILHFLLRQGFSCGENSTLLSLIIHMAVLCGYSKLLLKSN